MDGKLPELRYRLAVPLNTRDYLLTLLETDYFDAPKTGLELFDKCVEHFGGHVKPQFILDASQMLTGISMGKKLSRSPCTTSVRAVIVDKLCTVKFISS